MNEILQQTNSAGKAFVQFAGPMLIQSSVLVLILLIADLLLRKKVRAVFRYWMWMLVLVKLLLPTSLSLPMSFGYWFGDKLGFVEKGPLDFRYSIPDSGLPVEHRASGIERALTPQPTPAPDSEPTPAEPVNPPKVSVRVPAEWGPTALAWQGALFSVWLAVVIVMCLLLLQRAIFVRALVAQAEESTGSLIDALQYCCQQIAVKRKVGLKISPNTSSPAVCGLFRPVILMPQKLASNLGSDRLRVVLMHELAHVKRADLWVNLAQTFLQIVYFYNPLLWLANAIIRRVREQAVDEAVLVAMGDAAEQYPQTLLDVAKLAFRQPALSLRLIGVVESKSALASRIKHILNRPMPKNAKLGILGLSAIIIAAAMLLPMAKSANKSDVTAAGKNTEILVVRWMAVLEQAAGRDVLAISGAVETSSESYEGFICNSEILNRIISENLRKHEVIHISNNLTWLEPSPEYQRADSWADSAKLAHPLYKGYTSGGAGPYKLGTTRWAAKLDLRYESVTCLLNPGPRISGKVVFQGDVIPGHALAFLGSVKENEQAQAHHLVVWQAVEVPSRLIPYIKAIYSTRDWIQMGPIGMLNLAEEGFGRNKNLPAPPTNSDKWMRTLPDGSKVKLVAVFRPKDNPFLFWDPDGNPVSGLPQWHSQNVAGRDLAVVFERPKEVEGEIPAADGKYYTNYGSRRIQPGEAPIVSYGRGYGEWQDIATIRQEQKIEYEGLDYEIEKVQEQGGGPNLHLQVTMWYGFNPDVGIRLVAVDRDGKEYPVEPGDRFIGNFEKRQRIMYFQTVTGLSETDLDYFKLQKRPLAWAQFSGFATEPKEQPPVEASRSFSATLPNGVTVELVGLCEHPSEGKQWWGLDGQSIAKPYERLNYTEHSQDSKLYEIAYRLFGSGDIAFTIYSNAAIIGHAGPYPLSQKAQKLSIQDGDNVYGAILLVKPDAQSIVLEIGAGREGDWQTLCTQGSPVDKTGTAGTGVVFQPAIEKDGKTHLTIAHQIKDAEIRVVAVDNSGQIHKSEGFSNIASGSELGSCQARFNLPADQIKEIQFQTQKFQRVTFKNVSLKPGVKTDVQIEVEKAAVRVEVLTDKPAVVLDLDSGKVMRIDKDWPDQYDVGWDNDEGGSLFAKPDGPVRMLPIVEAENFADALSIAPQKIESLKQRGIYGVPADQSKYILIRTSQDNIVVVEVQEFDEGKAKIRWQIIQRSIERTDVQVEVEPALKESDTQNQVLSFGPIIELEIPLLVEDSDVFQKAGFIDFETGCLFSLPQEYMKLQIELEENQFETYAEKWCRGKGIDASAIGVWFIEVMAGGVGLVSPEWAGNIFLEVSKESWDSMSPKELSSRLQQEELKNEIGFDEVSDTFAFRTIEGNIGLLQALGFTENSIKIRYKMAQKSSLVKTGVQVKGEEILGQSIIIGAVDNKATLASGATVELLGLSYIPVTEQLWWRPDGSPLPQAPFDDVSFTPSVDPNWQQFAYYTIAIQIKGKPAQEVGLLKWEFTESVYGSSTSAYANEKRVYYDNIYTAATKFPKAVEKTTLRLGIVSGDWETIFAGRHYGFYEKGRDTAHVRTPERAGGPGSVRPDEKGVHIEVTYNITDRDFRVVAVDKDSKVHLSSRSGSGGTANLRRTTASFPDLTHDRLQEFRFQVRPYEWAEFSDISLRPGKEALAWAERQKAAKEKEVEKWLGQGKERQIRGQILILRQSRLDHINEPCIEQTETISAMRKLTEIGQAAVPELTAELQLAEHWLEKSLIAFVLRAIGDERAASALIEALGKSNYRGEYGVYVKDDELAKFMLDHQHRTPDESDREAHAIIIACPVIEITKALEKITGHSEGPDRFSPEAAEAVKQRWQNWWDRKR